MPGARLGCQGLHDFGLSLQGFFERSKEASEASLTRKNLPFPRAHRVDGCCCLVSGMPGVHNEVVGALGECPECPCCNFVMVLTDFADRAELCEPASNVSNRARQERVDADHRAVQ